MVNDFQSTVYGDFAADYESNRLADICNRKDGVQTGPFGSQLHQEDYVLEGTPIITVEHLDDNRILHSDVPCVSEKDCKRLCKYSLLKGDIVFSRVGSVDRRALVRDEENGWLFSGRCLRVRPNKEIIDPRYLSYFFGLPSFKEHIRAIAVGATMPSLNTKILSDVIIYYPPLPEQRAIAHILGTLDDKIELNRQMNETLEAMARAIFKSWFVDFDPVRAKAEGRDTGLPEEIAELFPDSFEETEVGEVPKGWKYCSAETVADVGIGKTPPRKESEWFSTNPDDIRWASIRDMGESGTYILDTTEYLTSEAVDKFNIRLVPNNTVLLSFKLTIGRVTLTDGEITTNEAIAHFKLYDEFHLSNEYLYLYLQKFDYTKLGSTSSIAQAVNSKTIKAMPILVPEESVITEFTGRFVSIFDKIKMNQRESRTLAELRDTLLPKLISGELRVNDLKINMEAMQ